MGNIGMGRERINEADSVQLATALEEKG